ENPLDTPGVVRKARELMLPVTGTRRTEAVIDYVNHLEQVRSVRELAAVLAGPAEAVYCGGALFREAAGCRAWAPRRARDVSGSSLWAVIGTMRSPGYTL